MIQSTTGSTESPGVLNSPEECNFAQNIRDEESGMKFSVIGTSTDAATLLQEVSSSSEHALVTGAVSGPLADTIIALQLPLRMAGSSEDAILDQSVDTVILAIEDLEEILRIARAATQAGKNVVLFAPADCSPAFSFELHLILDESPQAIIAVTGRSLLLELHPEELELKLNRSDIQQISLELPMARSNKKDVRQRIVQGLDLLSASGCHYSQVTALEALAPDGSLLSLLITLNSQSTAEQPEPPATLLLKPVVSAVFETSLTTACVLKIQNATGSVNEFRVSGSAPLLSRIDWLCGHREQCSAWMESFSETLELAEAVNKSLRRRRTVDVHFDSGSERGVFKSQMTAIGCGVLTFMMLGMVAYLVIAQLTDLPDWVLHLGRILWIMPLVLFLIAQTLLPLARDRSSSK